MWSDCAHSVDGDPLWTVPNVVTNESISTMASTPNSVASSMGFHSVSMIAVGGDWHSVPMSMRSVPMHSVPVQEPLNESWTRPPVAMEDDAVILNAPNPEQWAGTRPSMEISSQRPPNELLFGATLNTLHSAHSMPNRFGRVLLTAKCDDDSLSLILSLSLCAR